MLPILVTMTKDDPKAPHRAPPPPAQRAGGSRKGARRGNPKTESAPGILKYADKIESFLNTTTDSVYFKIIFYASLFGLILAALLSILALLGMILYVVSSSLSSLAYTLQSMIVLYMYQIRYRLSEV